jgi:hypothetical protein
MGFFDSKSSSANTNNSTTANSQATPTIQDSTVGTSQTKNTSATSSSIADSLYGDSAINSTVQKTSSSLGDAVTGVANSINKSVNLNLSGASNYTVTDAGAIAGAFDLSSKALAALSAVNNHFNTLQGQDVVDAMPTQNAVAGAVDTVAASAGLSKNTLILISAAIAAYFIFKKAF